MADAVQKSNAWIAFAPQFKSVLRIMAALPFVLHGTTKLMAFPAGIPGMPGTMSPTSLPGIAGVLEIVGGALLVLGLFTRPVAFLLAGEMAVAYFMAHFPKGFWPTVNGGEIALLYCFIWLYFSAAGAGPWSVDAARGRSA